MMEPIKVVSPQRTHTLSELPTWRDENGLQPLGVYERVHVGTQKGNRSHNRMFISFFNSISFMSSVHFIQ